MRRDPTWRWQAERAKRGQHLSGDWTDSFSSWSPSPLSLSLSLARLPAATSRCDIGFYRRKVGASAPLCPRHFLLHGKSTVGSSAADKPKEKVHPPTHTPSSSSVSFLDCSVASKHRHRERGGWRRSMYGKSPISPARLEE